MLQPGDMAPDFEIPVLIGGVKKVFHLSEHRGKQNLVLAFYPVNWEPVSAQQMIGYQLEREKFMLCQAEAAWRGQPQVRRASRTGTVGRRQRTRYFCCRQVWQDFVGNRLSNESASQYR